MATVEEVQPLLDVNESAKLLHVSPYTVRSWIRKGVLRATKLGRLVRLEQSEVQRLIEAGKASQSAGSLIPTSNNAGVIST
jgi:excisionase family DNA binding protein